MCSKMQLELFPSHIANKNILTKKNMQDTQNFIFCDWKKLASIWYMTCFAPKEKSQSSQPNTEVKEHSLPWKHGLTYLEV